MVRKAKLKAYEDFCKELSSKCGKIEIYKLTKIKTWGELLVNDKKVRDHQSATFVSF